MSLLFLGCSAESDEGQNAVGSGSMEEPSKSGNEKLENGQTNIVVKKISVETVERMIEGMEEEVTVNKYEILPFGIAFKMDEDFGSPEVRNGVVNFTTNENEYQVTLKVVEDTTLDEKVEELQKQFDSEQFNFVGELEDTPKGENGLVGKMQLFSDPTTGFYVYEVKDRLLVITYEYPVEGGDGMGPLLENLTDSISLE